MPIYFVTADGPQPIPEEIISQGAAATEAYIAEQGWQPPEPAPADPVAVTDAAPDAPTPAVGIHRAADQED